LAKIAIESEPVAAHWADGRGARQPASRILARGHGWTVRDVVCSAGPHDRPFEEQHSDTCIAIVVGGSFQYQSSAGRELLTPGSILLGNAGQYFECGHEHGVGDRCVSFSFEPGYFESLAAETGVRNGRARFSALRVPPVRELSSLFARACAGLAQSGDTEADCNASNLNADSTKWEQIGIELAGRVLDFARGSESNRGSSPAAEARVTRVVRMIETHPDSDLGLAALAREAKLSRYHFLRIFQQLTGLTPHQYVLRARLRWAATRLSLEPGSVLDIALDSRFGDVSNFNHAFRAEFGISPRSYRKNVQDHSNAIY